MTPGTHSLVETARRSRKRLQLAFFLVIWPGVNLLMLSTGLQDLGLLRFEAVAMAALRLWLIAGASYLVILFVERRFPALLHPDHVLRQGLTHVFVIVGCALLSGSFVQLPDSVPRPATLIVPRMVVIMEIVLYVSVLRILRLQERSFETVARAREAELHVLRTQSNPHFLFNTLNLITAEITKDPANAREIVYDLADLLRSNIKMARQTRTTLGEEMKLVSLYLGLQQRRFSNRLTYAIDVAPETKRVEIPALLLQPVIENTIKWAVAPYASRAHVTVETRLVDKHLHIVVSDTGPSFDETNLIEGDGFRILRQTLELHYSARFEMHLRSTDEGGVFSLALPLMRTTS